jgi:outer membrane protein
MSEREGGAVRRGLARGVGLSILIAASAGGAEPRRIAFDEAVQIALERNNGLQRAEIALTRDRLAVTDAKMRLFPDLRASLSGARSYGRAFNEAEGVLFTERVETVNARLSSSVTAFDWFSGVADLRQARLEERASTLDAERARQTVVFDVITGYLALIEAAEQMSVQEENAGAQEDQLRRVETLVEAGERPISDLYQQQANVAQARLALVEAREAEQLRRLDLVQVLQLDAGGEYEFVAPPIEPAADVVPGAEGGDLLALAIERRADLAAQQTRREAAEQGERSASGARWPSVSLSASYGSSYSSARTDPLPEQFAERWSASVGLGVSVPLFDRHATKGALERARLDVQNAELGVSDLRQAIAVEVRRAMLDRDAARERLRAAEARVRAASQALAANEERYAVGAATIYEVGLSRTDLVEATSLRVRAQYAVLWQEHLVSYYLGELDPAQGLAP